MGISGLDSLPQRVCFDKHLLPNRHILPKRCISSMTQVPPTVKGGGGGLPMPRLTYPSHQRRHDLKILGLLHIEEGERTQEKSECCLEGQQKTCTG